MNTELTEDTIKVVQGFADGWNVKRAIFHQSVALPAGGDNTTSFYSDNGSNGVGRSAGGRSGVKMKYTPDGLFCEYKGTAFIVPLANVVVVYL